MGKRDDYASRLLKYMADMGMPEAMTDQEQNQTMRLVAQFAERERRRIRRAIAPALADATAQSGLIGWSPGALDRTRAALAAIDRATRTPKRRSRNAR